MRAKKLRNSLIASAVLLALAGTKPLIAATYVWTGGGDYPYWMDRSLDGTYSNWGNSATAPGANDDVVFGSGFASGTPNLDVAAFNSLTIDTNTSIELDGSVRLASGNLIRTSDSSGTQYLNISFFMPGPSPVWDLQGSGGVIVNSGILGLNSSQSFTKTGGADLTLGGFSFNAPVTVAGGSLILNGGWSSATFQGADAPLVTNQGTSLLVENLASLATQGQPRIDNGGSVTVTGPGSNWSNYDTSSSLGTILVGRDGAGALAISNGATLTTSGLVLGGGLAGSGRLSVTSGGQLSAASFSGGDVGGGAASILVTGAGSVMNVNSFTLGTGTSASLSISAGGTVNVTTHTVPSKTASLNLGSGAVVTVDGGSLTVLNIVGPGQICLKSDPVGSSALTIEGQAVQTNISGTGSVSIPGDAKFVNCNNTYTGQTSIGWGVVEYNGGSNSSSISVDDFGWLFFNDGVVLNLGNRSIIGKSTSLIVYSNATVNGGILSGGPQDVENATFNGTTIADGTNIITAANKLFTLNNVTISGSVGGGGSMALNGTAITSTGSVKVLAPATSNGLQNSGILSIGSGTLSNSGTDLKLGAGSQTTIISGAAISLTGGTAISALSASLINDGIVNGPTNIYSGSVAGGSGQYIGCLNVFTGGRVWPGDGASSSARIASLSSSSSACNDGGIFHWEISASAGTPGVAWDLWNAGTTSITPTGIFDVEIESLGSLPDWDASTSHSWLIATSDNGAFTPDALSHLAIVDDGFASANDLAGGSLSLTDSADGANLYLTFTPAPEPASIACLTLCAGGLLLGRRRRK